MENKKTNQEQFKGDYLAAKKEFGNEIDHSIPPEVLAKTTYRVWLQQAKRHETEIAELVAVLKGARHKPHCLLLDPFEPESHCNCGLDAAIVKYEVKK